MIPPPDPQGASGGTPHTGADSAVEATAAPPQAAPSKAQHNATTTALHWAVGLTALAALLLGLGLWQKLSTIQEQLARQSADASAQSLEARALARQAGDLVREVAARQGAMDARLAEVALQRGQLEELLQTLSRSRDENLVVDIDSALRLAQQQAQLTGSVQPLVAALKSAEQRLARAAQPRLSPLQRALARDIDRVKLANVSDTPSLLLRMDELVRLSDELPLTNAVGPAATAARTAAAPPAAPAQPWWAQALDLLGEEARKLLRVSPIEYPEAALLSPEQSFFVRENLKLRLLNARLALLSRQAEPAKQDLQAAHEMISRYFDTSARRTQTAQSLVQQVLAQARTLELPRIDETLAALTTAATGR